MKVYMVIMRRSTSHGFYSGSHWKCSTEKQTGWFATRFDDSLWPNAVIQESHAFYSTADFTAYHTNAKVIWSDTHDDVIYCRARMCYGNTSRCNERTLNYLQSINKYMILDDVDLLKLAGVGIYIPERCYPYGSSLLDITGPHVRKEECIHTCLVSLLVH